jgi:hypothetical protein
VNRKVTDVFPILENYLVQYENSEKLELAIIKLFDPNQKTLLPFSFNWNFKTEEIKSFVILSDFRYENLFIFVTLKSNA